MTLALAYVAADRAPEAVPILTQHLEKNPKDQEALIAGIFAVYSTHVPAARMETIAADRTRVQAWARTYNALKGEHQTLVDAWLAYLQGLK